MTNDRLRFRSSLGEISIREGCKQCTGLKDKKGTLIYEDDYIQLVEKDTEMQTCTRPFIGKVVWDSVEAGFKCKTIQPGILTPTPEALAVKKWGLSGMFTPSHIERMNFDMEYDLYDYGSPPPWSECTVVGQESNE